MKVDSEVIERVAREFHTEFESLSPYIAPVEWEDLSEGSRQVMRHVVQNLVERDVVKVGRPYRLTIDSRMASDLIRAYRLHGTRWFHVVQTLGHPAGFYKLVHWGLLECQGERKSDGNYAGYWRLTEQGVLFARGEVSVPQKYVHLSNNIPFRFSGKEWTIFDALKKKFNWSDLMYGDL